ncbi:DUF6883 domain-containing protein [Paraburkholderia sacchari]|uniref:DUF6883 domain-containing protein n=1 Tax=Paraburkholderia sacchari TaxID=159450 RepID=UPI001FD3AE77|nr:DUF6883 domain-containing protein [Paraburkholderia sacchari]
MASAFAGKLNGLADDIGGATGSMLAGNIAANVLAGLGGALVGGGAGAATASNADLYNRSTGNASGQGGTGSQLLDWVGDQFASAARGAENLANQFGALVNANGPQGPYVTPDDLNGPGGNSKPPATGGSAVPVAVCVPPVCTVVPAATLGTPGYAPGNATLNSGNSDSSSSASNESRGSNNAGFDTSNLEGKLRGYLLDPDHSQNQSKANWFNQALGFDQSNWQDLASQLRFDPATAVPTKTSQYGQTYEQVIPITGPNGKTIDTTFVFMKDNSGNVKLVTGIPAKK